MLRNEDPLHIRSNWPGDLNCKQIVFLIVALIFTRNSHLKQVAKPTYHGRDFVLVLLEDCKVPEEHTESLRKWELTESNKEYAKCFAGMGVKRLGHVKEDNTLDVEKVDKVFTDLGRPVPKATSEMGNIDVDSDVFAEKFFAWKKESMAAQSASV